MFIEILAKSFIWIIYCMLFTLLLRLIGLTPNLENLVFSISRNFLYNTLYYLWLLITLLQIKNTHLKVKLMKNRIREYRKQKEFLKKL